MGRLVLVHGVGVLVLHKAEPELVPLLLQVPLLLLLLLLLLCC